MANLVDFRAVNRWFWQLYVEPLVHVSYDEWSERRLSDPAWSDALLGKAGIYRGPGSPEDVQPSIRTDPADNA